MDPTQVIIRPVLSEKTFALAEAGKYTFRVHDKAHKTQIRQAIELLFDVNVLEVRHRARALQAQAPRPDQGTDPPVEEGDRPGARGADDSDLRRPGGRGSNRCRFVSRSQPRPGRRFVTYPDYAEITRTSPEKSLVEGLKKSGGRNSNGRKTSRHRGGGAKRLYRMIDFKRRKDGVPAKVAHIEYDPNRSAYIALLHYADGEKRYILAPQRLRVGMTVQSGRPPRSASATACRSRTCRPAPWSTTSS